MKSYFCTATAHLLHKVLEDVDFTLLSPCVNATIAGMNFYTDEQLREVNTLSSNLKDYNIHTSEAQNTEFKKQVQEKYITALVSQLKDRLSDVEELEAFSIFNPLKLLKN